MAATAEAIAAKMSAALREWVTSHPPIAEPSGKHDTLRLIETVRTRPNHSGSVRRCLTQLEQLARGWT